MRERNATLLRKYIKFCGPERLPEKTTITLKSGYTYTEDNAIIVDFKNTFTNGSPREKMKLSKWMQREMASILTKITERCERGRVARGLTAWK